MHSPLNSYVYIYWILDFKCILLLLLLPKHNHSQLNPHQPSPTYHCPNTINVQMNYNTLLESSTVFVFRRFESGYLWVQILTGIFSININRTTESDLKHDGKIVYSHTPQRVYTLAHISCTRIRHECNILTHSLCTRISHNTCNRIFPFIHNMSTKIIPIRFRPYNELFMSLNTNYLYVPLKKFTKTGRNLINLLIV